MTPSDGSANSARSRPPITDVIETHARANPAAVAIIDGGTELSYGELESRAEFIAAAVQQRIAGVVVGAEPIVAICLPRGHRFITAMLGVLRAGAAYLPINLEHPDARTASILADSNTVLAIADPDTALPADVRRLDPAEALRTCDHARRPQMSRPVARDPRRLAYVMYTSGSTGTPKGVLVEHGAISRLVIDPGYITLRPDDAVGHGADVAFDATTFEVWAPLAAGARIILLEKSILTDPNALGSVIGSGQVTALFLTTALFNHVADAAPATFAPLRYLLFGGEQVSADRVRSVLRAGAPKRLLHVYGPTEATTFATAYRIDATPTSTNVPIGHPIAETKIAVLDEQQTPVEGDEIGELYIGGNGVARGYLKRPDLTAEAFPLLRGEKWYRTGDLVRSANDGAIEYVSRVDDQIKIRGYRIEPGEVEAALLRQPGVAEALVTTRELVGGRQLIGYVSTAGSNRWDHDATLDNLRRTLPDVMVPAVLVEVSAQFKLTPNGKIDRAHLPDPAATVSVDSLTQTTELEATVAALWCEVLRIESVGVDVNFYAAGGDSISAARLAIRGREEGLPMTAKLVFTHQTVADQARTIEQSAHPSQTKMEHPYVRP